MNKVYKVIWSKAKNCYVVASELAKSHTKAPASGIMSRAVVAGVLACVLSCGAVMPVYAGNYVAGKKGDADISLLNNNIIIDDYDTPIGLGDDSGTGGSDVTGTITLPAVVANAGNTNPVSDSTIIGTLAAGGTTALNGSYFFTTNGGHISESTLIGSVTGSGSTFVNTNSGTVNNSSLYGNVSGSDSKLFNSTDASLNNSLYMGSVSGNNSSFTSANGGSFNREIIIGNVSSNNSKIRAGGNLPANGSLSDGVLVNNISYSGFNGQDGNSVVSLGTITKNVASNAGITTVSGYGVGVQGDNAVGIGTNYYAGANGVAIGNEAVTINGIALGHSAKSINDYSVAIGKNSSATGIDSVAIGTNSSATRTDEVSIGSSDKKRYLSNVANGTLANDATNVTQTGSNLSVSENYLRLKNSLGEDLATVALTDLDTHVVTNNYITVNAGDEGEVTLTVNNLNIANDDAITNVGTSTVTGEKSTAVGTGSTITGENSIAVGTGHTVSGNNSGAIGDPNIVNGANSYVVGNNSTVHANIKNAFVLGNNTSVSNGLPSNWNTMTDAEKETWANGLQTTDIKEGVVALGNNISVSLDNKSPNSRSSTSAGTPEIEHVVAVGDNVVIGEENAIGIGHSATATALNTVAIGEDAQSIMEGGIAVGHSTRATGAFSNALGYLAQATGEGAGAFGQDAQATGKFATAFGRSTRASAESATAIGNTAHAVSQSSIAIGTSAIANGGENTNAVAIGRGATIGSDTQGYGETLAVGSGSNVQNTYGTAIGAQASVTGQRGTAVGSGAQSLNTNALAVGSDSKAYGIGSVAVGNAIAGKSSASSTDTPTNYNVSIGTGAVASKNSSSALGYSANASGAYSNALGYNSLATGTNSFAAGGGVAGLTSRSSTDIPTNYNVAVGYNATAGGENAVAVGYNASAITDNSVAVGRGAGTNKSSGYPENYTALGTYAVTNGTQSTALGYNSKAFGDYSLAIGGGIAGTQSASYGGTPWNNTISVGYGSYANNVNALAVGINAHVSGENSVALGSGSIANANNVVSVGTTSATRKIVNVTDGTANTDASTIGQTGNQLDLSGSTLSLKNANGTVLDTVTLSTGNTYTAGNGLVLDTNNEFTVKAGTNVTVDANGVNVAGTGIVTSGDTGLVTGNTVYEALQGIEDKTHYIGVKSTSTTDANYNGGTAIGTNSISIGRAGYDEGGTGSTGALKDYSIAIGDRTTAGGLSSIAIGQNAIGGKPSSVAKDYSIAIGRDAKASIDRYADPVWTSGSGASLASNKKGSAIALGSEAEAENINAIAIGYDTSAKGSNAIMIGMTGRANGPDSIGIGTNVQADASNSVSIGANSASRTSGGVSIGSGAINNGGVAIGNESYAGSADVVSFGHKAGDGSYTSTKTSRIINVTDGYSATDVATVGQTIQLVAGDNISITEDGTNNIGQKKFKLSATSGDASTPYIGINSAIGGANEDGSGAVGTDSIAIGRGASANDTNAIAIGVNANTKKSTGSNDSSIAIGDNAQAWADINDTVVDSSISAIAIGKDAKAEGTGAVSIGYISQAKSSSSAAFGRYSKALGTSSTALGSEAVANGSSDIAIGFNAKTSEGKYSSVVIGSSSFTNANNSVALGANSVASNNYVVSIGHLVGDLKANGTTYNDEMKRRIVNVADGTSATNAATVGQTIELLDGTNTVVTADGVNDIGQKKYKIDVASDGDVADGNTGIVTGGTVYTAVNNEKTARENADTVLSDRIGTLSADGNYIRQANNVSQNLSTLDSAVKTADNTAIKNITANGTTVTYTKGDGTTGTFTTQDNNTEYTAGNGLELTGTEFKAKAGTNVTVDDSGINVAGNGTVADGNTGLVSGGMLFTEGRVSIDGNYVEASNTVAGNLSALDNAVKDNADDIAQFNTDLSSKANMSLNNITDDGKSVIKINAKEVINVVGSGKTTVEKTDVSGVDTYTVGVTVDGAVAEGNTGIVDGGTVYNALKAQETATNTALTGKANVALDNITDAGKTVIQNATNVVSGDSVITVIPTTENGVKTYTVTANISPDGQITEGNTGLVSGGTVYSEVRPSQDGNYIKTTNTTGANLTALDTQVKANVDAITTNTSDISNLKDLSNITEAGQNVIKELAKGSVNVVGTDKATVTKSDVNGVDTYTVSVKADGQVAQGNENIVSGGTVYDALSTTKQEIATDLAGKANVALDNVTDAGHTVIKTDAKSAINVVGGTYATVDKTDVNGVDTYTVNVATDGAVVQGNNKLVTGGTVYDALQAQKTETQTALDGKANVGLDNITDTGKSVVRTLAQEAVKVVNGSNTTVTEGTDGTYKTYAVSTKTDGAVASGDTGIVTGGAVYDAIQNAITGSEAGTAADLSGKANVALDNITDAGKTVIKSLINVKGSGDVSVAKTNVSGVDTYTVSVDNDAVKSHYISINSSSQNTNSNYDNNGASGQNAIAIGQDATATAKNAVAIGYKAKAEGEDAFAFGRDAISQGKGTIAFTGGNEAYGDYSMAWGFNSVAGISTDGTETYIGATAFGTGSQARNDGATAMGNLSIAEGENSVAMGNGARTREDARASLAMGQDTQAAGTGSFAGGTDSIAGGFNSFAHGYTAEAIGSTAIAMGDDAKAVGDDSVALGYNSKAYGDYSVAILGGRTGDGSFDYDDDTGEYDVNVTDNAIGAFAVGYDSVAMKDYTVAIGRHATVENDQSIALGEDATVVADSSVALGYGSVATEENVISVGHKQGDAKYGGGTYDTALNRKIVNVAPGVNDTDAVNVKQLTEAVGDKANEDLDNITDAGHSVIKSDAKSVINVVGADKATVTKADVNGVDTYTVSVKADGAVADGNENIVSGGIVYNALQAQKNEMNTALDGKANIGLDNITDNGKTVVRSLAQEAVKVVNGTNTTVTEGTDGNAKTYAVNVTTNGTVTSGDTGVVTGGTVYDAIQDIVTGDMTGKANISLDNVNDAGHAVIKTDAKSAINVVGNDDITVNKTDVSGVDTYNLSINKTGAITSGNEGIVTGGTVFTETRPASDGNYIAVNKTAGENLTALDEAIKANEDVIATNAGDITNLKNLSNITEAGETVVKNLAKGSVNVVGTNKATVTKSNVNGVDTYMVDVTANGIVTSGDTNIVSGGIVYDALQAQNAETATALDGKANIALDNITNDGKTVVRTLAQESVKVVAGSNTTVTEGTEGTYKTYAVNTKTDGTVSSGDTGIVTGGAVYDAIQDAIAGSEAGTATDLSGKANTALDNITDTGHDVIKTDAKSVISVAGNNDITVNKTDVSGVDTYNLSINKTGVIASGNEGIVTGGTVFSETRPASNGNYIETAKSAGENLTALDTQIKANTDAISDINTGLDDKANTSLDNITNDGKTVIKNLAKGSVNVVGEGKAIVNKTDVSGVDTYTVSVTADGFVAEGNGDIVSGGTVYEAIQGAISTSEATTNTALEGKANVTLDNVTDAGHDVIKSDAKSVINVTGGEYATVEKTDVNGVDTYTVNVATDGAVASGNTKLVTGGTVYEAMTAETRPASDGNYISATNTAGANLTALDSQVKINADAISTNTSDITNLKDLSNITEAGENVIKELSKGSVNVVGADKATVTKLDVNGVDTYTVSVKADGTVAEGNENIVSGGTVYSALQTQNTEIQNALDTKANKDASNVADNTADWGRAIGTGTIASGNGELVTGGTVYDALQTQKTEMNTALGDKANVGLDNITDDGKTVVRTLAQDAVKVVDGTYTTVTEGTDGVAKTYAVNVSANGTIASGDTGLVTGGTVYDAIQDISGDVSGKANTSLNNISTEGEGVIKDLAKGAVNVVGTDKATVTKTDENGVDTYTVSVKADGTVAEGNENIVSGGTVYEALQNQKTETDTALAEKANVDASNVTDAGAWGTKIATGSVADGDVKAVSGGTMFTELRPDDGNYVAKSNTTAQNLTALDTQVKANADNISTNTSDIANLKDLSNITEAGESVIKDLSKGAVNVLGADKVTVTKSDVSGVDTYTVSVKADGTVTEGNENLVSGGTVYEALATTKDDIATDLAEKANVDASNIASNTAKWGEAIGTGTISSGNGELVTGGTVFAETRPVQDGNYILKENTAGANLTALDSQVKANADAITTNTTDISNLKDLSNITDAGKTVIKDLSKGSVNVVGTGKATVTKSDINGVDTYTVNVNANGQVAQGNEDIVTGGMVYDAIQNVSGDVAGKANVALDNITTEGETVVKNLAKGAVNVVGNDDVTVTKTDENGVDTYTVSVTKNGTITEGNEGVVTGGTVYNALKVQEGAMQTALDNKANVDASNITDDLPWANALGKGVVEQGNNQLVTGGTVYNAVEVAKQDMSLNTDTKLEGYAKVDASNVTNASAWADKLGVGTVSATDGNLVTGSTVATETRVSSDGNYVQQSNTAGQNIAELDRVLKETRDIAELAAASEDANAVHYDNADKSTVTLGGADGTLLTNLKDGELSATSKDAVTGKQLYETNQRVDTLETTVGTMTDGNYISKDASVGENLSTLDTQIKSVSDGLNAVSTDIGELRTGMDNKLNTNMDNLTNDGRTTISDIAKDSVKVTGSGFANVTSTTENNAVVYNVDVQANGKVEEGNTGLVDGGTVFDSIQGAKDYADTLNTETRDFVTDKLKDKADTDLGNLTDAGKEVIRDTMKDDLDKKANVDASNIDVNAWTEKLGTGEVADGNTGIVNGGTVFKALQDIEDSAVVKADFDAGAIRVGGNAKYDGIDVVDISKFNGEGRVMTGVITNPNDPNSAANVGYVDAIGQGIINGVSREFGRMDNKINRVGANAAAMASLTPIPTDDDTKWNIAAAMGNYRDATAGAVGVFYKPQDNVMLNLRGSFGSGDESMVGGGVTIALNKGSMPGVSKAQLAKAVNSQAKVIEQLQAEQSVKDAKIKEMEAKDAARDAEMAELKAQMAELAKQVKQNKG